MSTYHFNQLGNIQSALNTLRRFNQYLLFSVNEKTFENPLLTDYFKTPLDDSIEVRVEKVLSIAAAKTVLDNPNISQERKVRVAIKNARDLREAMRFAKLEYHAMVMGDVTVLEYNRRKRAIPLVQRVAKLEQAKKYATHATVKILAYAIAGHNGLIAVGTCRLIWRMLPIEMRESLILKSKEISNKALVTLKNYFKEFKKTEIGKVLGQVVEKTERTFVPHINSIWENIKTSIQRAKDVVKSYST